MFEDLLEAAFGPWGLAAVALVAFPGGRKLLRPVAKEAIRAGLIVSDKMKVLVAEVKEETQDILAEVNSERKEHAHVEKAKN